MSEKWQDRTRDVVVAIGNGLGEPFGWKKSLAEYLGIHPNEVSQILRGHATKGQAEKVKEKLGLLEAYFSKPVPSTWRNLADEKNLRDFDRWAAEVSKNTKRAKSAIAASKADDPGEALNAALDGSKPPKKRRKPRKSPKPAKAPRKPRAPKAKAVAAPEPASNESPTGNLAMASASVVAALEGLSNEAQLRVLRATVIILDLEPNFA